MRQNSGQRSVVAEQRGDSIGIATGTDEQPVDCVAVGHQYLQGLGNKHRILGGIQPADKEIDPTIGRNPEPPLQCVGSAVCRVEGATHDAPAQCGQFFGRHVGAWWQVAGLENQDPIGAAQLADEGSVEEPENPPIRLQKLD